MNLDEQISKRVDKGYRFELWNENVKPFHCENTLKTYTKQIQNPRNESFGGFLFNCVKVNLWKRKIEINGRTNLEN